MKRSLSALAAMVAVAGLGAGTSRPIILQHDFPDYEPARLTPRRSGYRMGRRFNYGRDFPMARNGVNPPGTKLAKQCAKGTLTVTRIR